jgi:transposase
MARPPVFPAEEKVRIVLSILAGEITVAEAARRAKVSEQSVGNWKRQFLEAGKSGLVAGKSGPSTREQQLEAEVTELTRPWVRPRWSCGCGRSPRRAGWALRGPLGDPRRGGHADHEVLLADRRARADLAPTPSPRPRRPASERPVAASRPRSRP